MKTGREIHKYGDTEIIETAKSTQENRWNHEVEIKDKSMGCMKCVALRKKSRFLRHLGFSMRFERARHS